MDSRRFVVFFSASAVLMTIWTGNSALQILPDSRKGQRNIGSPKGRQDVGGPGPAGTAGFRTVYGPHDRLSATLRADAFRAAAGHWPDALRGAELPHSHAARGNEKRVAYPQTMQARRLRYVGRHLLRHPPAGSGTVRRRVGGHSPPDVRRVNIHRRCLAPR